MADDPNPTLRAELNRALVVLDQQIRGMAILESLPISDGLKAEIEAHTHTRTRRRDLIQTVMQALDATFVAIKMLETDGYPSLPGALLPPEIFAELQDELNALRAVFDLFTSETATTVSVNLGEPTTI